MRASSNAQRAPSSPPGPTSSPSLPAPGCSKAVSALNATSCCCWPASVRASGHARGAHKPWQRSLAHKISCSPPRLPPDTHTGRRGLATHGWLQAARPPPHRPPPSTHSHPLACAPPLLPPLACPSRCLPAPPCQACTPRTAPAAPLAAAQPRPPAQQPPQQSRPVCGGGGVGGSGGGSHPPRVRRVSVWVCAGASSSNSMEAAGSCLTSRLRPSLATSASSSSMVAS